jgi:hypothetical protein
MEDSKPNRYKLDTSNVAVVPKIESLLSDALVVIGSELARYRAKAARGASLDTHESRAVREYVECICKLSKEAREAARQQDLSSLTNEELLQLATEMLSANNSKDKV